MKCLQKLGCVKNDGSLPPSLLSSGMCRFVEDVVHFFYLNHCFFFWQISVSKCDFLVDLATERETDREPNFEKKFKEWEVVIKKPFLDAERCVRNIVRLLNVNTFISAPFITFRLFWFNFQLAVAFLLPSISGAERSLKLQIQRSDWLIFADFFYY